MAVHGSEHVPFRRSNVNKTLSNWNSNSVHNNWAKVQISLTRKSCRHMKCL